MNQQRTRLPHVAVVGLGRVGLPIAAAIASTGTHVIGLDTDAIRCNILVSEPLASAEFDDEDGLRESLRLGRPRIAIASDAREIVSIARLSLVVVPTPSEPTGAYSLEYVAGAVKSIATAASVIGVDHSIVVVSTVSPLSMATSILPLIEAISESGDGNRIGLCYSPVFVALGDVIKGFLNPNLVLVGEVDPESADLLHNFYSSQLHITCPIIRMSSTSAEVTKLALNNFLSIKVAFGNLIGRLSHVLPGCDVDMITSALGTDPRVGSQFLGAGMSVGGPCLPRDSGALAAALTSAGVDPRIPQAVTDEIHAHELGLVRILECLHVLRDCRVAVLGLVYKANATLATESSSLRLCNELLRRGSDVMAFDVAGSRLDIAGLDPGVEIADSLTACLAGADIVVITTRDSFYSKANVMLNRNRAVTVLDVLRAHGPQDRYSENVTYLPFGRYSEASKGGR